MFMFFYQSHCLNSRSERRCAIIKIPNILLISRKITGGAGAIKSWPYGTNKCNFISFLKTHTTWTRICDISVIVGIFSSAVSLSQWTTNCWAPVPFVCSVPCSLSIVGFSRSVLHKILFLNFFCCCSAKRNKHGSLFFFPSVRSPSCFFLEYMCGASLYTGLRL